MQAIFADDPDVKPKGQRPDADSAQRSALHDRIWRLRSFDRLVCASRKERRPKAAKRQRPQNRAGARGLKIGDRYGVIFSKFDLSCALEKHDSLECEGYTRDDAERIGLNILLYSLHQ